MLIIPKWVFKTFERYGNVVLPNKVVKLYGEEAIIILFNNMYKEDLQIRTVMLDGCKKPKTYILERKTKDA